jgi:hypothetical protein
MNGRWADPRAVGLMRIVPGFEFRRALLFARVRFFAGAWLLILAAILYGYDRSGWWTPLLVLAAAADFYFAHRLRKVSESTNSVSAR